MIASDSMMNRLCRTCLWLALCVLLPLGGCSHYPPRPKQPKLDPAAASQQAMGQYDANKDSKIDAGELKKSPPLCEALETMDTDKDGALTATEIAERIKHWWGSGDRIMVATTEITLDGQPLEGATVTYEPEAFLGPAYQPASAVTDAGGVASILGSDPEYPGLYLGLYRVRVSKQVGGKEILPSRYNAETELAKEIAPDAPSTQRLLKFDLKGK
jgi:hypothetical protein